MEKVFFSRWDQAATTARTTAVVYASALFDERRCGDHAGGGVRSLVAGLSLRRGPIGETYGDWHRLTS